MGHSSENYTNTTFSVPECRICCESFPAVMQPPCGHELCALCVDNILTKGMNQNCPMCREELPSRICDYKITAYPVSKKMLKTFSIQKFQHALPIVCAIENVFFAKQWIEKFNLDVNTIGFQKYFPLHLCSTKEMAHFLCKKGAIVNKCMIGGYTPILFSCLKGNLELTKFLIEKGANFKKATLKGVTPFWVCCSEGNLEIAKFLIERGVRARDDLILGLTPFEASVYYGHLPLIKFLMKKVKNIYHISSNYLEGTPLQVSVQRGHFEIVEFFVNQGIDVNEQDSELGATPLFLAIVTGNLKIVTLLAVSGADLNLETHNVSPLSMAIFKNHLDIAKFLISQKVDIARTKYILEEHGGVDAVKMVDLLCQEVEAETSLMIVDQILMTLLMFLLAIISNYVM